MVRTTFHNPKKTLGWALISFGFVMGIVIFLFILIDGLGLRKIIAILIILTIIIKGIDLIVLDRNENRTQKRLGIQSNKLLMVLGVVNLIGFVLFSFLSHSLTAQFHVGEYYTQKLRIYAAVSRTIAPIYKILGIDQGIFGNELIWLVIYCGLILLFTIVFTMFFLNMAVQKDDLEENIPKRIFYWSIAFGIICVFASPILVMDFWYPIVWGRMILAGVNPYYTMLSDMPEFLQALPLNPTPEKMMYGPLWAVINGIVIFVTGGSSLLAALAFKLLLASMWIGSLKIIWLFLKEQSIWSQATGLLIFGWLPLGPIQGIAEGHNDIVMIFFILLWLYLLKRENYLLATLALAASVLIKYVCAPLFLLDFLFLCYGRKQKWTAYLPQAAIAFLFMIIMLGVFYRSPDFFDYFRITQTWHSFTIRIGIEQLENLFGRNDKLPQIISNLIFYFSAIYCVFRYCNKPSWEILYIAVQAILGMILFGIASHIWPWYILWIIGFVALIPKSKLSIWGLSVILLTPFSLILFRVFPNFDHYFTIGLPSLFIYLIAFLCFFLLPDRWLPDNLLSDFKIK